MNALFSLFGDMAGWSAFWGDNPTQYTPPITGNVKDQIPWPLIIGGIITLGLIVVLFYFIFR